MMRLTHDDQLRQHKIRSSLERARELRRLYDREASHVTLVTEAPIKLADVRERINQLEPGR
jgi:hypothetical protein